ncbi:uncharacterized protein F4812DRAFT_457074 [Daldinia caldariorum]|uniref:uncharacterized protein n=1 Tax=Daldinia caldariorum TaxID=326644 RepID=UPI002008834A|nr:uncharacterized protein F4812DRAFT_457074 [Daldinia caldariorum]KAI1469674.1 hypothetical protein F4812DRAFT_457074 [Daldinia caldariorum]
MEYAGVLLFKTSNEHSGDDILGVIQPEKWRRATLAYSRNGTTATKMQNISDADVLSILLKLFAQVSGREIRPCDDLFQQGGRVYHWDCPNCGGGLIRICNGGKIGNSHEDVDAWEWMRELAEKYSQFERHKVTSKRGNEEVVVLTGATGLLGAHILSHVAKTRASVESHDRKR